LSYLQVQAALVASLAGLLVRVIEQFPGSGFYKRKRSHLNFDHDKKSRSHHTTSHAAKGHSGEHEVEIIEAPEIEGESHHTVEVHSDPSSGAGH
jgi:hypothetical protein